VFDGNFTYDANGNVTASGNRRFEWTAFDKPRMMKTIPHAGSGGTQSTFRYDPDFNRMIKRESNSSNWSQYEETVYIGKEYERILGKNGNFTHRYTINTGGNAIQIERQDGKRIDEPKYLLGDNLGSTNVIINALGEVEQRLAFDPWGMRLNVGDTSSVNSITNRGYTGHEMDDEIGVINMNARIYDPFLGRFLSADPVLPDAYDMQSYNRYSYALGNPLKYVDPTGNNSVCNGESHTSNCLPENRHLPFEGIFHFLFDIFLSPGSDNHRDIQIEALGSLFSSGQIDAQTFVDNLAIATGFQPVELSDGRSDNQPEAVPPPSETEADDSRGAPRDPDTRGDKLDRIQEILDYGGLVPVVGTGLDILNAGISIFRGDFRGAAERAVGAVPIIGDVIRGGQKAAKAANAVEKARDATKRTLGQRLADRAQSTRSQTGINTVSVIKHADGTVTVGRNSGGVVNSRVQDVVREGQNKFPGNCFGGQCAEVNAISRAINRGRSLNGATIETRFVRGNNPNGRHGQLRDPCDVCDFTIDNFGLGKF